MTAKSTSLCESCWQKNKQNNSIKAFPMRRFTVRDFTLCSITDMILYYLSVCHTGSGVRLILDCVGGSYWQQNTDVLTTDGRWVLYGLMGKIYIF